jgi:hypothetical protein
MVRVMIFVEHPRYVSTDEAEAWLAGKLEPLHEGGIERVRLRRLRDASLRCAQSWAFMVELECRDVATARDAVQEGAGLYLLGDLRMLGMRPALALVEDGD